MTNEQRHHERMAKRMAEDRRYHELVASFFRFKSEDQNEDQNEDFRIAQAEDAAEREIFSPRRSR